MALLEEAEAALARRRVAAYKLAEPPDTARRRVAVHKEAPSVGAAVVLASLLRHVLPGRIGSLFCNARGRFFLRLDDVDLQDQEDEDKDEGGGGQVCGERPLPWPWLHC